MSILKPPTKAHVNALTPLAICVNPSSRPLGIVTPDHLRIDSAIVPIAGADSLNADAPNPPKVKLIIPDANEDN